MTGLMDMHVHLFIDATINLQDALARATEGATQAPPTVGSSGGFTLSL